MEIGFAKFRICHAGCCYVQMMKNRYFYTIQITLFATYRLMDKKES